MITNNHIPPSNAERAAAEQGPRCTPVDEERAEEAEQAVSQAPPSAPHPQGPTAESTQPRHHPAEPEDMEVEEKIAPIPELEGSAKLLNSDSDGTPITESSSKDLPKLPASSSSSGDKPEPSLVSRKRERSPSLDQRSPSPPLSADPQEALSSVDMEARLLPHSDEDDEDEEDDEPMKGDEHGVDIKRELQEKVKPELLLDETSNLSHGDESSSGFLGSPGEADQQLSMELGLVPTGRSHTDSLLTETDDSLPFEPLRSDTDKVKRRGSPGRSRVKQVRDAEEKPPSSVSSCVSTAPRKQNLNITTIIDTF